jgi:hypothetical protein
MADVAKTDETPPPCANCGREKAEHIDVAGVLVCPQTVYEADA